MDLSPPHLWLLVGVVFLAAEALGVSGVGLLFAGFGALTIGALLQAELISEADTVLQLVVFCAATALWTALLWKPMKRFRLGQRSGGYHNMVGETAIVAGAGIDKARGGEVTWSGTIMKAELDPAVSASRLEAGSQVTILGVKGATLIVAPKLDSF